MRYLFLLMLLLFSCSGKVTLNEYLTELAPTNNPIPYKPELIPNGMLVHRGIFSPDLEEYYYTISDKDFKKFKVKVVKKENGKWSDPKDAFFTSIYNEHGMSFSPDNKYIYFSSTRPVNKEGVLDTWHIWRSKNINGKWTEPEFVDIPNLRHRLVSHPTIASNGNLYFHSGAVDYSDLFIYYSKEIDGKFIDAIKLPNEINFRNVQNTPYILPDESYLLFESVPDLYISYKSKSGDWSKAKLLNKNINKNGRGNPYVSPDKKYLFFVASAENNNDEKWFVYWVSIKEALNNLITTHE